MRAGVELHRPREKGVIHCRDTARVADGQYMVNRRTARETQETNQREEKHADRARNKCDASNDSPDLDVAH